LTSNTPTATPNPHDTEDHAQRCAVVIHLFYEDQWPDFAEDLDNIDGSFSLFVTLRPESRFERQIHARYPDAVVLPVPNLGRDVAPFLALLPRLYEFDLVCKLHTKRREGQHANWRNSLLHGLLGSREAVNGGAILGHGSVGIVLSRAA